MLTRENDISASQPSGVYNFGTSGSALPLYAEYRKLLRLVPDGRGDFGQLHAAPVQLPAAMVDAPVLSSQDDWRRATLTTIGLGIRYSYETSAATKYGTKSEFDPNAIDP